jgi:hypothetical protein
MGVVKRFEGEGLVVRHSASCKCIRFWKPKSSVCGPFILDYFLRSLGGGGAGVLLVHVSDCVSSRLVGQLSRDQ